MLNLRCVTSSQTEPGLRQLTVWFQIGFMLSVMFVPGTKLELLAPFAAAVEKEPAMRGWGRERIWFELGLYVALTANVVCVGIVPAPEAIPLVSYQPIGGIQRGLSPFARCKKLLTV